MSEPDILATCITNAKNHFAKQNNIPLEGENRKNVFTESAKFECKGEKVIFKLFLISSLTLFYTSNIITTC